MDSGMEQHSLCPGSATCQLTGLEYSCIYLLNYEHWLYSNEQDIQVCVQILMKETNKCTVQGNSKCCVGDKTLDIVSVPVRSVSVKGGVSAETEVQGGLLRSEGWGMIIPDGGCSKCQGPKVGICWAQMRNQGKLVLLKQREPGQGVETTESHGRSSQTCQNYISVAL